MAKEVVKAGISDKDIADKIYIIRGIKVMLDRDLAEMYDVQVKALNQSVKRNIERFPEDFMFQLSEGEWSNLKSQFVTSSLKQSNTGWGGLRKVQQEKPRNPIGFRIPSKNK
jgi:ORF6N domain